MPVLIFLAVREAQIDLSIIKIPIVGLISILISILIAFYIGKLLNLKKPLLGAFIITCSLGNTGYLGYPLTIGLFGESNLIKAVFYDVFATVVIVFTLGLYIAETHGQIKTKVNRLKEIILFPPTIALVVGFLSSPIFIPQFFEKNLNYIGQATIPLIMLAIGLVLKPEGLNEYRLSLSLVIILKLIISPIFALVLGKALIANLIDYRIAILQTSMPVMTFSIILGIKFGLENRFIAGAIFISTLLSIITIPFWQLITI